MTVGRRLRQIRLEKGIKLTALARRLSISHPAVSQWESGESRIDADQLPRIAEALGVSPCAFFEEEPAAVEPAVEQAAKIAAREAVEDAEARMREIVREELRAAMAELLPREQETSGGPRVAEEGEPYKPSLAEVWARGRVRQWEKLSEAKQRRILEILEEPEGAADREA